MNRNQALAFHTVSHRARRRPNSSPAMPPLRTTGKGAESESESSAREMKVRVHGRQEDESADRHTHPPRTPTFPTAPVPIAAATSAYRLPNVSALTGRGPKPLLYFIRGFAHLSGLSPMVRLVVTLWSRCGARFVRVKYSEHPEPPLVQAISDLPGQRGGVSVVIANRLNRPLFKARVKVLQ